MNCLIQIFKSQSLQQLLLWVWETLDTILLIASSLLAYALFVEMLRRIALHKMARLQARIDRIKALMAPIYPMTPEEIEEYAKECEAKELLPIEIAPYDPKS